MTKVFISYSHEDVKIVKQFAFQLSLRGFDIWMDEKNIAFQSNLPKFKNGLYEERIEKKSGSTNGSICEQIQVEAVVFNPNEKRVKKVV